MKKRREFLGCLSLVGLRGAVPAALLSGCATHIAGGTGGSTTMAAESAMRDDADLVVTLDTQASRSAVTAPLALRVVVDNPSDTPRELLLWNTPFESTLSADLFEIVHDGRSERVAYQGRLVKRLPPPPPNAVITLAPGERLERVIDLARHYALDRPGRYTVRLDPDRLDPVATLPGQRPAASLIAANEEPLVIERLRPPSR